MMESVVLLSNEVALPGTFGSGVISIEKDSHRVQESSWKVISHYQQPSDSSRSPSFPPVIGIKLEHQFGEFADTGVINCRLIDEGDVLKDVFEDYNLLVTEARPAVFIRLPETELVFTDLKMIETNGDIEFQSSYQAVAKMLSKMLLASTPMNIRTTVTIRVPISPPCSTLTQSAPQSVYDKVFENPLIMDHIIKFVTGKKAWYDQASRTRDIQCVIAVNKCWRASLCRVLEANGGFIHSILLERLNSTIKSLAGGFPLHNVIPYQLSIGDGDRIELSGRVLRFLGRYPPTALECDYDEALMQELHHIVQFPRLKVLSVHCSRLNLDIIEDIQRLLTNFPGLGRFYMYCMADDWIPSQEAGLILPESLKSLEMELPLRLMTVVSDQNQFPKVKHFTLVGSKYNGSDESLEMEEDSQDEGLEVEEEEDGQPDADDELNVGENQIEINNELHHEDRNNPSSIKDIEARICTMLKTMGPSLVSLELRLDGGYDLCVSVPGLPKLKTLAVNLDQMDFPLNLPSLETICLQQGSIKFLSTLFIEGRQFEWVTKLTILDVIEPAFVDKIVSALPNCRRLRVVIRDDLETTNDGKSAAALGEIFCKLPRLRFLDITICARDTQFLDLVFTGLSIQEITRLKQTAESFDSVVLGPRSITNLNCLQTLEIGICHDHDLEIEVSDFLFRIAFMKMDLLTTLVLGHGISAGAAIMQQWKTMGRRVGGGDCSCLADLV